jgi:hypothetical protein
MKYEAFILPFLFIHDMIFFIPLQGKTEIRELGYQSCLERFWAQEMTVRKCFMQNLCDKKIMDIDMGRACSTHEDKRSPTYGFV